ncbi:hypothetical protein ABT168_09365 [Streptomyces sp. NPDC001793]|uniref:hypothetical protein n=1 Tax=Streptomyces sp. NPDC001793 TaxID=3154657 RepID=UPI003322878D
MPPEPHPRTCATAARHTNPSAAAYRPHDDNSHAGSEHHAAEHEYAEHDDAEHDGAEHASDRPA